MRIVVDAMGSDAHPAPDVEGAILALREYPDTRIILVGVEPLIRQELARHDTAGLNIEIVHTDDYVTMEDKPGKVVRAKPNASIALALRMVKEGKADAAVTAGNTGAALAFATLQEFKRMENVMRPAFPAIFPIRGSYIMLADSGANADCRPEWLLQFAVMCAAYAEHVLHIPNPKVALLSNGEEEGKGNELVKTTLPLLANSGLNFIGNVEPKDVLNLAAHIVITDGFTGNIFIKSLEAMGQAMFDLLRQELTADLRSMAGAALARPAFRRVYKQIDPFEIGGAPLLGVNGILIVGHGRTNAKGIKNAINQARKSVANHVLDVIRQQMSAIHKPIPTIEK
jgi:glycerol-3-phosphate acyltransferase PlsX